MQLSALTENLATLRTELKSAHEKLFNIEEIKAEKAGNLSHEYIIYYVLPLKILKHV